MKKMIYFFVSIVMLLAFAACGKSGESAVPTDDAATETAAAETTAAETAVSEETSDETETEISEPVTADAAAYKSAYLSVIRSLESKYGVWDEPEGYDIDNYGTGMVFCDLFDWDQNGIPELFAGYIHDTTEYRLSDLEVYTFESGEAKQILHGKPGREYMNTSSLQNFSFLRDEDGSILLRLYHSENIWDNEYLTQYRYRDGKVTAKELYALADNYDPNEDSVVPPELTLFKIDGQKVDKAQYDKARLEKDGKVLYIICNHVDYAALTAFLNGETDNYQSGLLTDNRFFTEGTGPEYYVEPGHVPAWVSDLVSVY